MFAYKGLQDPAADRPGDAHARQHLTRGPALMQAWLSRRDLVAQDTQELEFDLGGQSLDFAAGQYCRIALPTLEHADTKSSRKFSLLNAPADNKRVVITTRTGRTGYKRSLCSLPLGSPVEVQKVKGDLVLPAKLKRPLVMIAGGIGIVPFISMLRHLEEQGVDHPVTLLYFNRNPDTAAYLQELTELERRMPSFRLLLSMTRHASWTGVSARLTGRLLTEVLGQVRDHEYFVVGTPAMVDASVAILRAAGVPGKRINEEDFSGYKGG